MNVVLRLERVVRCKFVRHDWILGNSMDDRYLYGATALANTTKHLILDVPCIPVPTGVGTPVREIACSLIASILPLTIHSETTALPSYGPNSRVALLRDRYPSSSLSSLLGLDAVPSLSSYPHGDSAYGQLLCTSSRSSEAPMEPLLAVSDNAPSPSMTLNSSLPTEDNGLLLSDDELSRNTLLSPLDSPRFRA